jgi:hypothetical protein
MLKEYHMDTYSHSKLEILRKCFLLFKYKYLDKLPEVQDKSATDFGEVCHFIAENYKGTGKIELETLLKQKLTKEYKLTDFYKNKIPLALKNIHAYNKLFSDPEIEFVNKELDLTIPLNDAISLTGKIDIMIKYKNGKYRIVDYKTSKAKNANHTNQLSMYKLLIHKKFGIKYEDMQTDIVYLALENITKKGERVLNEGLENIILPYDVDEMDVNCLIMEIESLHNKIKLSKDKNVWNCNPTWFNCTYCGFKHICDKKFQP